MQRGFTLVELSLVLVLIGLLVGGILGGQSLLKAAALRSQLKDFEEFSAAHFGFQEKYQCIAGDCGNIADVFPSIANGNNDGRVECWPATGTNECGTYMLAMEAAGFIEARRNPMSSAPEYRRSKLNEQHSYYVNFQDRYAGGGYSPASRFSSGVAWINYMSFNSPLANGPALTPEQAWNYDTKVDDGRPYIGKFLAAAGGVGGAYPNACVNGSEDYNIQGAAGTTVACRIFVKME